MTNDSEMEADEIKSSRADRRVLELLSQTFGTISAAATEIINLEAILNLPKGTEHFVADLHGEYDAFNHLLKNGSGNIKRKVNDLFGTIMGQEEIRQLCSLIYYPEQKLAYIHSSGKDMTNFYEITLHQLVKVLQLVSSKYTRSKVRKSLPREFAYIIEELLHEAPSTANKQHYYARIIETIILTGQAEDFITAICNVIQKLSIDQLHILGDIFDRGQGAHLILDKLNTYQNFDMQWGNHDALWMGATAGNKACIANVLRISLRYDNLTTLEDGYGINLVPLASFALETYADDRCELFMPCMVDESDFSEKHKNLIAKMHKAITIIQFKLEGQLVAKYPEWGMTDRRLLHTIDYENHTVEVDGKRYHIEDINFPTVNREDPYALSDEETELMDKLQHSFFVSDKLRRHIDILLSHGCLYNICNSNLMYHASVPLNEDGSLKQVQIGDRKFAGKELMHNIGMLMREAFNTDIPERASEYAVDYYTYVWCGPDSPLFDKSKMATFERYLIKDPDSHKERKGWYYQYRNDEATCDMILDAFGVTGKHRHIINGHVPVRAIDGENPIKANGKLMVIDGGMSKAYRSTTGIAGYTLVFHSRGFDLVQHEPFSSPEEAICKGSDIISSTTLVELSTQRLYVKDTDKGKELKAQADELRELLYSYRHGLLKEHK